MRHFSGQTQKPRGYLEIESSERALQACSLGSAEAGTSPCPTPQSPRGSDRVSTWSHAAGCAHWATAQPRCGVGRQPLPCGIYRLRPGGLEILAESPQASWGGRRVYETVRRWKVRADFVVEGPHGGLVTDPLQTALDLGRGLDFPFALVALDAALRVAQRMGIPADVARALLEERVSAARGCRGMRGVVTAATYADARAESPLESIVRGRIIGAGLPVPRPQVRVVGRSGREYRSDLGLALPGDAPGNTSLLIEADGLGKFAHPGDLAAEKRRQHDLEGRGHRFVRVLYGEAISSPEGFLETVGRLVAEAD